MKDWDQIIDEVHDQYLADLEREQAVLDAEHARQEKQETITRLWNDFQDIKNPEMSFDDYVKEEADIDLREVLEDAGYDDLPMIQTYH